MEFRYEVKIPKQRVAVLLGVKGSVKKRIQSRLDIKLEVDSETGDVALVGEDSLNLITAQNIIKAIGRGFNPDIALEMLDDDFMFDSIDITHYVGTSKKGLERARSRAIGTDGKARKYIEHLTNTKISIYGKTISIIGNHEGVDLARRAYEGILSGQRHSTVYAWLEKHRKNMKFKMY